ncbi:MAG: DUF4258 domain-containing protein [Candidatus Bathyarchaeia archaeon]
MTDISRIKFTRHALRKFEVLKHYGFLVSKQQVIDVVRNPTRLETRGGQFLAVKPIDSKYALRVVYEVREAFLVIITFYPVRRVRYGV